MRRGKLSLLEILEMVIVIGIAFGNSILWSIVIFLGRNSYSRGLILTTDRIMYMAFSELIILILLYYFLKWRGWTVEDFNLDPNWRLTGIGVILAISSVAATTILHYVLKYIGVGSLESGLHFGSGEWQLLPTIIISILNPFYEEIIVVGYVMGVLMKNGKTSHAINLSVGIRLLYHLYQGIGGVITIVPMGLIFSYYYCRNMKLWPLVLAHGVMDFYALTALGLSA